MLSADCSAGAKIFPNILMWLAAVFVSYSSQVNSFSDAVLSLQGPSSRIPMSYLLGNWLLRGKKIKASDFLRSEVSVSSIIERLSEKQRNRETKLRVGEETLPPEDFQVKVTQSCSTFCNTMSYTVHRILQARILEWVAVPFSRGSSQPRD